MPPSPNSSKKPARRRSEMRFRFPCGHVEAGTSIDTRIRQRGRGMWVRCRRCNLIALVTH